MDIASTKPDLNAEEQKYYVNPILASVIEKEFNDRYYSDDGFDINDFREDENEMCIRDSISRSRHRALPR